MVCLNPPPPLHIIDVTRVNVIVVDYLLAPVFFTVFIVFIGNVNQYINVK